MFAFFSPAEMRTRPHDMGRRQNILRIFTWRSIGTFRHTRRWRKRAMRIYGRGG